MLWTDKAKKILEKYWGFSNLKEKQIAVINELLSGNDVIGLLPTGYGKSMCYLIPPLVSKKAIIIISPLISLMDDQKEKLLKMNIPVSALHGNNKNKDCELFEIIDGQIKIIYMSPEFLIKGDGLELINTLNDSKMLGFLAIDEAHCISVWGHDFRPEYLKIKSFRDLYPHIPILAVTATATNNVVKEIATNLNLSHPEIIKADFDRPNLFLECISVKKNDINLLKPYFKKYKNEKIIIYTNSRQNTMDLSNEINQLEPNSHISDAYHAGMSKALREKVQTNFSEGKIKIIVSTIAFGMGVDQIVRCVIIFGSPSSIEEYWQQIGRAGRDNLSAETVLFYQYKSLKIAKSFILKECTNQTIKNNKIKNLSIIGEYFYLKTCRRRFVLEHFDQLPNFFCCNSCDNCNNNALLQDITNTVWDLKNNIISDDITSKNIIENLVNQKLIKINNNKVVFINSLYNWNRIINMSKFTLDNLPEKLKIKLPIQQLCNSIEVSELDRCDNMFNKIKIKRKIKF